MPVFSEFISNEYQIKSGCLKGGREKFIHNTQVHLAKYNQEIQHKEIMQHQRNIRLNKITIQTVQMTYLLAWIFSPIGTICKELQFKQ